MQRRRFLTLVSIGAALLTRPRRLLSLPGPPPRLSFHVAGVKFQTIDMARLARGMQVELRRGRFEGETCFAIYAAEQRLGFVPRSWVGRMEGAAVRAAYLSDVRPHAVPWKRLEVTLDLGGT